MVKFIVEKIKPGRGFSHAFHIGFLALLPVALFFLVRFDFNLLALTVLLLSKWRMLAVHPRHWIAHVRTNAVDIIVGLSVIVYMIESPYLWAQIVWVVIFEGWLLYLKPRTDSKAVMFQALVAQVLGLNSIFFAYDDAPMAVLVFSYWVVSYFCARHFFNALGETRSSLFSAIWAFFAGALMWVLAHWLLFVGPVAQPAIILNALGLAIGGAYYLERKNQLTTIVKRQIIITVFALILVLIIFSDWGDKAV